MSDVAAVFKELDSRITRDKAEKINAIFQFTVGDEVFLVDLTNPEGPYVKEGAGESQCEVTIPTAEDWVAIATGKMNPTMAFMQGKIKVPPQSMGLAMKLQTLLS